MKTFNKPTRVWVNAPSTHQVYHEFHGVCGKPLPIALIGAIYVAKGCDPDDVAEVTYNSLKNGLNLADELYKAFY